MREKSRKYLMAALALFVLFAVFTAAVMYVDVQPIGPEDSNVGFATVNKAVFGIFGYNEMLYNITEFLGYAVLAFVAGFGILGFLQLVKRRNLFKVDADILILGCCYLLVGAMYLIFDRVVINYRPVLIEGVLKPSYPSSHTLMTVFVMTTAIMQFNSRIKNKNFLAFCQIAVATLFAAVVLGRFMAGEHWITDIIGGIILGTAYVMLYCGVIEFVEAKKNEKS